MLMPMVKRGTVTDDIAGTIQRMDEKLNFNSDKFGWIHMGKLILFIENFKPLCIFVIFF